AQGAAGTVGTTYVVTSSGLGLATASCNSGDFATGGGYNTTTAGGVFQSSPIGSPPSGWSVSTTDATQAVTAFVVCATA
ncbi:hypothetical protein AB0D85_02990, partial [Streptomyces sp. NPDC048277]